LEVLYGAHLAKIKESAGRIPSWRLIQVLAEFGSTWLWDPGLRVLAGCQAQCWGFLWMALSNGRAGVVASGGFFGGLRFLGCVGLSPSLHGAPYLSELATKYHIPFHAPFFLTIARICSPL